MKLRIELSTDTVDGAVIADALGADRIEVCSAGGLGGLTPGPGLLAVVLARCRRARVHVLIRLREGGFRYSVSEVDVMLADVRHAVVSGAAGVVVGALTARDELDGAVLADLIAAAGGLPVTVHRAIDVCADPVAAVGMLAALGVRRVLSSGGAARAEDGVPVLRRMVAAAGGVLSVMACGGIRPHNARAVAEATGVRDLHAAPRRKLRAPVPSAVDYGTHAVLDEVAARALVELAHAG